MEEKNKVSIKQNIVWNSIGSFVMFFCQWVMMVLVVRLSGYGDSGILSLSISCGNIFLIIAAFGVKTFQVSDIKGQYKDGQYFAAKILTIILTLVVAVVWVLVSNYESIEKTSIILYTLYIMVYSYADALYGAQQKKWRMDLSGKSMCIRNVAAVSLFCILIGLTKNIKLALLVMLAASLLVLFIYDLPQTKKITEIKPDFTDRKALTLIFECFPFAIYTFLHTMVLTVPKLAVRAYYDKDTLGIYAAVLAPVTILQVAATFVINPISTLFAEKLELGERKQFKKILLKCVAMLSGFLAVGILVAVFLGNLGLTILYGEETAAYSYLLVPMVFITMLTALTILLGNLAIVLRDRMGANLSGLLGLAASIAGAVIFIPGMEMQGASFAFIMGLLVQDVVLILFIIRWFKKRQVVS